MQVIREHGFIRFVKWMSKLLIFSLMMIILISAIIIIGLLYLRSQPLPPHQIQETTTIYAADGKILDTIHQGQNRTYTPIELMPDHLLQAFIAVEDQRFFEHYGLDTRRIAGAVLVNLRSRSLSEGASTITQQLARNLYLTHEKTWKRKLNEAIYTIQLEMNYSKGKILEQYLNQIYFGHSSYGVESAAKLFFDKKVYDLSLAESAMLAGIPRGPRYYSPWLNMENAKNRQELILHLMHQQGFITEEEKMSAIDEELSIQEPYSQQQTSKMAPYFNDYIRYLVVNKYNIAEEQFDHGGLRIYTTLDPFVQSMAEKSIEEHLPEDRPLQSALVAIDPKTGYIKAMVGGRDYSQSPFNRAFGLRHPGSSIKPFLYYAALENGLTPLTLMKSEPTTFTYDDGRATYTPRNFNDSYPNDYITMEQALARSDNIYAVKTHQFLGEDVLVETLHRLGINRSFQPLPSFALGAQGISLLEMVQGYSVLANEGKLNKPQAILKIEDRNGNVIFQSKQETKEVLDPAYTFILNRMLRSVFEPGGTAHRVSSMLERPVSGKTGSTDTDAWLLGFTPQLVAGVWVGYDQNQLLNHNNDGRLAAVIFAQFMESSLAEQMPALYPIPEGVMGAYINPDNGLLATEHCPTKRLLYFKEGTEPIEYCHEHIPDHEKAPEPIDIPDPTSIWEKFKDWWEN